MEAQLNMSEDEIIELAKADYASGKYGKWRFNTGRPASRPLKDVSEDVLEEVGEEVVERYKKLRTAKCTGLVCCGEQTEALKKEERLTTLYNNTIIRLMALEMKEE